MRLPYALLAGALLALPLAHAQADNSTSDPTVNQSDFDTSPPPADDAYLNDTNATAQDNATDNGTAAADPTLSDSDLDTSIPSDDLSWLNDSADAGPSSAGPATAARATPGFDALAVAGAALVAVLVAGRRR